MKKLFCAILMLLLCVSCFAGTLYIKTGSNGVQAYENVEIDDRSGPNIMIFWSNGRKIVVATHSEWWYVE
jgi:hypothetical protein